MSVEWKNLNEIETGISVSGQIYADDLKMFSDQGIKTIVNMRPDKEGFNQPLSSELADSANAFGISWHNLFIIPGQIEKEAITAFKQILQNSEKPMHLFCKSGTRSVYIWALTRVLCWTDDYSDQELLERAAHAGYKLTPGFEQIKNTLLSEEPDYFL